MFAGFLVIALLMLAVYAFCDIQIHLDDPQFNQKKEEWFAEFLEHNKKSYRDPELAWRYNVVENLFHGIDT